MKLAFSHFGRQFFFITLVVAERREVLSRVLGEKPRPELTRRRGKLKVEKGQCFGERVGGGVAAGGSGATAPVRAVVFARDCYIELSFDSRQLKAVRHYIKLNPARRLWKLHHPDLFVCRGGARISPQLP